MPDQLGLVFVAYAHADAEKHLKYLGDAIPDAILKNGKWRPWSDRDIKPGDDWRQEIEHALAEASVCVLLITQGFMKSRFIANTELPRLLRRRERDGLRVIPVMCEPCHWNYRSSPLTRLQFANDPSRPIGNLRRPVRQQVWVKVAVEIEAALKARRRTETPLPVTSFRQYELVHSVFANGYAMSHRKLVVQVPKATSMHHRFYLVPAGNGRHSTRALPSFADLTRNANGTLPYPTQPFFACAASAPGVSFHTWRESDRESPLRAFEARFPRKGTFDYQWMWGSPSHTHRERPSWLLVQLHDKQVDRLRIRLRIRLNFERPIQPAWTYISPETGLDVTKSDKAAAADRLLRRVRESQLVRATLAEQSPVFRCYDVEFGAKRKLLPRKDVLIIY